MPSTGSSPLQGTGISHKPLSSAFLYCLPFPNPSLGPRVTCPPAPRVPCSCAWAESCPLPSLAARGMIWATGTSAEGPAMPAAPGGGGGWHLPPTCARAGSALCNLSDSCAGSPHASWHHLCLAGAAGSALARDIPWHAREGGTHGGTWRRTQSICAPSVLLTRARGGPCACSPCPALHSLLPLLAPHSCSLCSAPCACSPCQALLCCPGWRCGSHGAGAAGLVRTTLQSVCAQGGDWGSPVG